MSFDQMNFETKPNLKFQEVVAKQSESLGGSCNFAVYHTGTKDKDLKVYLATPFFDIDNPAEMQFYIRIIFLADKKEINRLEGHKDRIMNVRYFKDPKNGEEFLVSADRKYRVIVWKIPKENPQSPQNSCQVDLDYDSFIYSTFLCFEDNKRYLVVTNISGAKLARYYDLDNVTQFIEIQQTKDLNIYFAMDWLNKKDQKHYFIFLAKGKILIISRDLASKKEFNTTDQYPYNLGGIIFTKGETDYLIATSTYGQINIWDLTSGTDKLITQITRSDAHLYNPVKWDERFVLFLDNYQKRIIVLDMEDLGTKANEDNLDNLVIRSSMVCHEFEYERFIQKVIHPVYGEALLSVGVSWEIKLIINRNITGLKQ